MSRFLRFTRARAATKRTSERGGVDAVTRRCLIGRADRRADAKIAPYVRLPAAAATETGGTVADAVKTLAGLMRRLPATSRPCPRARGVTCSRVRAEATRTGRVDAVVGGTNRLFARGRHADRRAAAKIAPYARLPAAGAAATETGATVADAVKTLAGLMRRLSAKNDRGPKAAAAAVEPAVPAYETRPARSPTSRPSTGATVADAVKTLAGLMRRLSADALVAAAKRLEDAQATVAALRVADRRAVATGPAGVRHDATAAAAAVKTESLLSSFGGAARLRTILTEACALKRRFILKLY